MSKRSMAAIGAWVLTSMLMSAARGGTEDPVELLASARRACGRLDGSTITVVRKDKLWRIGDVRTGLDQNDNDLTDSDMERLSELGTVESLTVSGKGAAFTAAGLAKLPDLKGLRSLSFRLWPQPWKLGDDGLKALKGLNELENLDLGYCEFSGDLTALGEMPKLRRLKLVVANPGKASKKAITAVLQLKSLEELELSFGDDYGDYSKELLDGIASLKNLRVLVVPKANGSIGALGELPHLEHLVVDEVMPKHGALDLSGLRKLQSLSIRRIAEGHAGLALPDKLRTLDVGGRVLTRIDPGHMPESLEKLRVRVPPRGIGLRDLRDYVRRLKNLREVVLDSAGDQELERICVATSIRALTVGGLACPMVSASGLAHVADCRDLESLTVSTSARVKSEDLLAIVTKLPKLRRLEFPAIKDAPKWMAGLARLKALRALTITTFGPTPKEYSEVIADNLSRLPDLEELTLKSGMTETLLNAVVSLRKLRHLSLRGANLTDDQVKQLTKLRNLRVLDLSYSRGFSDTGLAAMMDAHDSLEAVTITHRQP